MKISHDEWKKAKELERQRHSFATFLMTAMLQGIETTQLRLRRAFPEIWRKLKMYERQDRF